MAEYSKIARGSFTSAGVAKAIYLPFQPQGIKIVNRTASDAFTDARVLSASWDVSMAQGTASIVVRDTTMKTDSVTLGGFSTFEAGLMLQYGAAKTVTDMTKASPAVVTVTSHGYSSGDVVIFQGLYETSTTGMAQLDGIPFTITVIDANSFSIPWNTNQSNFTVISGAATGITTVKKVLYPDLYVPGAVMISAITTGTTTTIDTASAHNFVVGQEVAFRIPSSYGTIELNSLPNVNIPGSPIYGYVVAVTDYNTFVVDIDSSAYTAFDSNQTIASVPGLNFAQVVAVGDVNTGGYPISAGSALYPPPYTIPIGSTQVNSIGGPAIKGSFFNNTRQGFVIGAGTGVTATTAVLVGAAEELITWEAFYYDMSL